MRALVILLPAVLVLGVSSGCVSFSYERELAYEPVPKADVEALRPGESDIGDALARLGAPLFVWEGVDDAVVLAYGSEDTRGWGVRVSVPLDRTSASFQFDDRAQRLEGWILVFDDAGKLQIVRAGMLRDLRAAARRPPAYTE